MDDFVLAHIRDSLIVAIGITATTVAESLAERLGNILA
jgi:hypothetical protein